MHKKIYPKLYTINIVKIINTKFKKIVIPGDMLLINVNIKFQRMKFIKIIGKCYVNNILSTESEMILKINKLY